jgi:hypothetical protein
MTKQEAIEVVKERLGYYERDKRFIAAVNVLLKEVEEPEDKGEISDGYHTFNELYQYRMLYNAAFFNDLAYHENWADGNWHAEYDVHKSKRHSDGEECFGGGWFIVMAELPTGQISNHYEMKYWDLFNIPEKEKANVWDGHTPQEAAERLKNFLLEK